MFKIHEKYTIAQLVELIGTDSQKKSFEKNKKLIGNPKKALLKELETMGKYEETKEGRRSYYLITEIFENKKEKYDGRSENGKEIEIAELGLLKYLARRSDEEKIPHTRRFLSLYAGLCNENFAKFNLSKKNENITDETIEMEKLWNQTTKGEIKNRLDGALNSLKNKGLIHIEKDIITVRIKNDNKYYVASRRQKSLVVEAEKEAMDQMKITTKKKLFCSNSLSKEFYTKVIEKLNNYGIVSYYYGINIIQAPAYYIEKEVNELEERFKVNSKFIELYQNKIDNAENEDLFGDEFVFRRKDYKYTDKYKEKAKELNNEYIKLKTK